MKINIKKLEKQHNIKILYLSEFGSSLYGTNSENSDKDYKGVFLPNKEDLLLQKKKDNISITTGRNDSRNTKNDVDIELWSIHKFINLLKKGETGAIDLLFSMFRKDTIIFEDTQFTNIFKTNYKKFLSKNARAFVGYCLGQASRYGIKGSRLGDLQEFNKWLEKNSNRFERVKDLFSEIPKLNLKYVSIITQNDVEYLQVLGKLYIKNMTIQELKEKTKKLENQFGDRTKLATKGVDWKALSHAVRVLLEFKEILETGFLKFPLKEAEYIKKIKYNSAEKDLKGILDSIHEGIKEIEVLLEKSDLPENTSKYNKDFENIILSFYK